MSKESGEELDESSKKLSVHGAQHFIATKKDVKSLLSGTQIYFPSSWK